MSLVYLVSKPSLTDFAHVILDDFINLSKPWLSFL